MARFRVNWTIAGMQKMGSTTPIKRLHHHYSSSGAADSFQAGDVIEANLKEVEQFVARDFGGTVGLRGDAVLTPIDINGRPLEAAINRDALQAEYDAAREACRDAGKIAAYKAKKEGEVTGRHGMYTPCSSQTAIDEMRQQLLADPKYAPLFD